MLCSGRWPQFVVVLVFTMALLYSAEGACNSNQIECETGGQCVHKDNLCDQRTNCLDSSDEDNRLCKMWPPKSLSCSRYSDRTIYYNGGCYTAYYMCRSTSRAQQLPDSIICEIMSKPKLEFQQKGMNMSNEVISLLSSAVNSTLDHKMPDCPMLYTRVGHQCLSFFSPAKVSWAEARQFCISIYGDLWQAKDFTSYGLMVQYMTEHKFTSDYWIGGRYGIDTNAWSWVADDLAMPLGAPYWAVNKQDSCQPRGPPHTDPYSPPPSPLPNARCYRSVLSPKHRAAGWCSAMTYEYFFYWSDEMCDDAYSPLCVFTGPAATIQADEPH